MRFLLVPLLLLLYPIALARGLWIALGRWLRNFSASEVGQMHRDWITIWTELWHPGRAAWENRNRIASYMNQDFNEPRP